MRNIALQAQLSSLPAEAEVVVVDANGFELVVKRAHTTLSRKEDKLVIRLDT